MKYYFKSRENPRAPLFVTTERWEAEDMAKHPDYVRVDEQGRELQSAAEAFDNVGLAKSVEDIL